MVLHLLRATSRKTSKVIEVKRPIQSAWAFTTVRRFISGMETMAIYSGNAGITTIAKAATHDARMDMIQKVHFQLRYWATVPPRMLPITFPNGNPPEIADMA